MERNKVPDSGGPLTNGFLWIAVLAAGTFLIHEVPWQGSRPVSPEPKLYAYIDKNRIDARLWQDPLGTAARGREELNRRNAAAKKTGVPGKTDILFKSLCTREANDFLALGVMVLGGSYPEYAEIRRRARYAVFAGLNSFGYVPEDQEHLRYFEPKNGGPVTIDEGQAADGKKASDPTFPEFIAYEWLVESEQNSGKDAATGLPKKILLLWLDGEYFGTQTLARTDYLQRFVSGREGCARASGPPPDNAAPDRKLLILGPADSGELKGMVSEAAEKKDVPADAQPSESSTAFYAYGATAADRTILSSVITPDEKTSVADFFNKKGVRLLRTIGKDDALASQLSQELTLRNIRPAERWCARRPEDDLNAGDSLTTRIGAQHVVLIAEWDTVYGRTLPRTVAKALSTTDKCPQSLQMDDLPWLRTFTYLRGLDGQKPTLKAASDTNSDAKSDDNGSDTPDKSGSSGNRGDEKRIERPEGASQLDYLRRLAIDLRAYNRKLQTNGASIRAVGVLGSDVYDKLMIVQALNEEFPDAIFFTTDLDARLMHPKELAWTRNLLVASNFGLKLSPGLQREIAPFRDSYETSIYLSTIVAINNAQRIGCVGGKGVATPRCTATNLEKIDQAKIDQWLEAPRVFEVGRNSAFDFSQRLSTAAALPTTTDPVATKQPPCGPRHLAKCGNIHPSPSPMFPQPRDNTLRLAVALLFIGTIALAIVTGLGHRFADRMYTGILKLDFAGRAAATTSIAALLAALVVLAYLAPKLWAGFFGFLTEDGSGVPFTFMQGLSLWPTELLRLIALGISCVFIYIGWKSLDRNVKVISGKFLWHTEQEALSDEVEAQYKQWSTAEKIWNAMSFRFPARFSTAVGSRAGLGHEAVGFWLEYIYRGRFRARIVRVAILTALYYATGYLLMSILGWPVAPTRGTVSLYFDKILILVTVFSLLLLIFFVVDAIAFAAQMVRALQRDLQTGKTVDGAGTATMSRWPKGTLKHFKTLLNVGERYLDQWIAMRFIAERTSVVAPLIYYPFIVISLMIVSRSAVFANWNTPIALIMVITGSVFIVAGCAIWLRMTAESARKKAIEDLTLETIRLSSEGPAGKQTAGQLEIMIAEIRALRIGAFAPYSQQPFLTALLFPLGSFGGTILVEYLTKANL